MVRWQKSREANALLKLVDSGYVVRFDERTITGCAGQFGATVGHIVIPGAICGSRKLLEKIKIGKGRSVDV